MQPLILHIPHASTTIPIRDGYLVGEEILQQEINKLTDWYTDDLFESSEDITVKVDFSRIFCDVERFVDDEQEVMAQYGMGMLYTHTDAGQLMRKVTPNLRRKILEGYYLPHHKKLEAAVRNELKKYGHALIIDCHSFSDIPFERDLNKKTPRPNINIGTDAFHTSQALRDLTHQFFVSQGLSVGLNWPYSGTMVPMAYYHKNKQVQSILIEVNRKLYLDAVTCTRNSHFNQIKSVLNHYLHLIRSNVNDILYPINNES